VFRAYDSTRERLVAVKLFKLDVPPERAHKLVGAFEQLIAAAVAHPALVTPLATGISGVSAFLAQDYVAADSLDLAVREHGAAPTGNALQVAAQLAGALDLAAAAQLTHGALHPRDVLLSSDDTRLTGLGVTRALEKIGIVAPVRRPYSAPERIAGGDWDRRADVFSLAALMHELMWGRRISGLGANAVASLTAIPGSDLAALRDVFSRALAEDPDDRFGTAPEFAAALRAACPGVTVAPASVPKRRAARADEPRLPLDEGAEAAPDILQAFAPAEADPDVQTTTASGPEPHFAEEWEVTVAPAAAPEIEYRAVPEVHHEPPSHEPRASMPAGLITGRDSDDEMSAMERTRSAVWPLFLALVVGIAIGFAGGFFAGSREQPVPATAIAAASMQPVAPAPALTPAGKEFTEAAVTASPKSERKTQNPELRTQNAEPKNLNSEISNLKSPAPPPVAEGRLLIRSRPAGARVAVDGKDYGATPAAVRDLAPGAHRVKITRDGFAALERRVVITSSQPVQSMTVALVRARATAPAGAAATVGSTGAHLTGALAVDSRPAGARVFVDDKEVGTTPMALPSVSAGSHVIRLEHEGYRGWSSSVRIMASEQNRVTASLER
jgi:serine/threonine-protein kinase